MGWRVLGRHQARARNRAGDGDACACLPPEEAGGGKDRLRESRLAHAVWVRWRLHMDAMQCQTKARAYAGLWVRSPRTVAARVRWLSVYGV